MSILLPVWIVIAFAVPSEPGTHRTLGDPIGGHRSGGDFLD